MFCPKCGADNPTDAKYCQKCAFSLNEINKILDKSDKSNPIFESKQGKGNYPQKQEDYKDPQEQFKSHLTTLIPKKDTPQPRKEKKERIFSMGILIMLILIIVIVFLASQNGFPSNAPNPRKDVEPVLTAVPVPEMTTVALETTIPVTGATTSQQSYKIADVVVTFNTNPQYGFKMDYPSEWTYAREYSYKSYPAPLIRDAARLNLHGRDDRDLEWKGVYNFSSPDGKSHLFVYFDYLSESTSFWNPIDKWANNTIKSLAGSYCLDSIGYPTEQDCGLKTIYHRVLLSHDPVTILGSFEARKLVFSSLEDKNHAQYTLYLMHSGTIQGYNMTIPYHPELGVKVEGPVWDYGDGGQGCVIEFYTPADQVNTTSDIFNHMINSFEITSTKTS